MFCSTSLHCLLILALTVTATAWIWPVDVFALPATCLLSDVPVGRGLLPSLDDADLETLRSGLDVGSFTSVDLVKAYTARILEVNSGLRAVTEINPDALTIATRLDAERSSGSTRGPLHGIPILLKNNIATKDQMNNTAGSYALLGAKGSEDSTVVDKLRQAGAIILGKSNLSQWGNYRGYNASDGWSAHGGQTLGPYLERQNPSGSSSGSGVATALGLVFAALGTETHGSILLPAEANNVVGIKPTVGLTSRHLVIPISEHQDTVGPFARSVKDAAYVLSAIVGVDPKDNYTSSIPFTVTPDYAAACDYSALSGKRIGVPRNLIHDFPLEKGHDYIISAFETALEIMRDAGAIIVDDIRLPGLDQLRIGNHESLVLAADFLTALPRYFSSLAVNPHNITDLAAMRNFTKAWPDERWPEYNIDAWNDILAQGWGNDDPYFWSNWTAQLELGGNQGLTGALKNHSLDAMVVPTFKAPWLPAVIGSPVVTVPLGRMPDDAEIVLNPLGNLVNSGPNFPFGISFMAEHFSEKKLIGLAYAFEQRTKIRESVVPIVKPETDLVDVVWAREEL